MDRARVLVALQVAVLVVTAVAVVARFQVFALADEMAHYDYVQTVAENARLPTITDVNHAETRAIDRDLFPRLSDEDPRAIGLAGVSYEAFQPPLYYLAAAPAFALISNHFDKVRAVRAFDALLLGVAAWLVFLLARAVAPARPLPVAAAGLAVLLWPGVTVRAVTISPSALELVTVTALALVLWRVHAGGGTRWVVAAGALAGACLLTKTTLVFVLPVWLLVLAYDWKRRQDSQATVVALALPLLMLAPWLAFNHSEYGTLTATSQAQAQQRSVVNPGHIDFGVEEVVADTRRLPHDVIPREWQAELDRDWISVATILLALLPLVGLLGVVATGRGSPATWILAAPAVTGYAVLAVTSIASDWPVVVLRYLFAGLPALAVGVAAAVPARRVLIATSAATALACVLWFYLAGAFMFTDVGDALGIPKGGSIYR